MKQSSITKFSIGLSLLLACLVSLSQVSFTDFGLGQPAYAAGPLCVRPGGNDGGSCACGDPFQHCRSVQRALNVAATGDTIRVAEGNYGASQAGVSIIGSNALIDITKGVTLEGGWQTDGSGNFTSRDAAKYEATVLDGENTRRVIHITGGSNLTIDGFLVTQGKHNAQGAGIYVFTTANLIIANSVISGNQTTTGSSSVYGGAGVFLRDTFNVVIKDSTIRNNSSAFSGGGILAYETTTQLRIEGTNIISNSSGVYGGGIYAIADNATLVDVLVKENSSHFGGGLHFYRNDISLQNVDIQNNTATSRYGGMYLGGSSPTLTDVSLTNNTASGGDYGGGSISGANASITNLTVMNNTASGSYGGLYISGNDLTLSQATIKGNRTNTGNNHYAGLSVNSDYANLDDLTIENNEAGGGAASLYLDGDFPTLSNITVANNTAKNGYAGIYIAAYSSSSSRVTMTNLSVYNNASQTTNSAALDGAAGIYVAAGNYSTGGSKLNMQNVSVISNSYTGSYAEWGGMVVSGYGPVLSQVTVMSNTTTGSGVTGGLDIDSGDYAILDYLTVRYNRATANSTSNRGGGIYLGDYSTLRRSIIMDNYTYGDGGGIYSPGSGSSGNTLENNIIAHNSLGYASGRGSGVYLGGNSKLLHNTIVNNTGGLGEAVYAAGSGNIIRNAIIADHTIALQANSATTLDYNVLSNVGSPGYAGSVTQNNNRYCDPTFSNSAGKDYHLLASDSCAKDFSTMADTLTTDVDGDSRPVNSTADAGADEATGPVAPVADFSCTPLTGVAPLNVSCTDASTNNPTSWAWNFGDSGTSTAQNPSHTYNSGGTYDVSLTASNSAGSDSETKSGYITVYTPCVVDFTATPTSGAVNTEVSFTNTSTGDCGSWSWIFGDGGTSTAENPTHIYASQGNFTVSLSSSGGDGGDDSESKSNYIEIVPPPIADFSCTPLSGNTPLDVSCTNASTGQITSYSWTFGDGGTSSVENPTHSYTVAGVYTVKLTVTGPGGSDIQTKTDYMTVNEGCVAGFSGSSTTGIAPLAVNFTNEAVGDCSTWAWTFGDGGSSTDENPSHTYTTPGVYTVTQQASGPGGSDDDIKLNYITVYAPAQADFTADPKIGTAPLMVQFTDQSSGDINTRLWDFGDGDTSNNQNPSHVYLNAGTYTVSLTVNGLGGEATETKVTYIVIPKKCVANFTATPTAGAPPLTVQFTNKSTGDCSSWAWDFNDGGTSNQQNPSHVFINDGSYTVTLTASGPGGTSQFTDTVSVGALAADFDYSPTSGVAPLTVVFTDTSASATEIVKWQWLFGDGATSSEQNPSHTYNDNQSVYNVTLIVEDSTGNQASKTQKVTINEGLVVTCGVSPLSGIIPLTVTLSHNATGYDQLLWNLGNGTTSLDPNLNQYRYDQTGNYTVTLTGYQGDMENRVTCGLVEVKPVTIQADFEGDPVYSSSAPLTVQFTDLSTGGPFTGWLWNFGDGTTSIIQNPSHTYNNPGSFDVSLTVTGTHSTKTETKTSYINITSEPIDPPIASFIAQPTSGIVPLKVIFTSTTKGAITNQTWNFGDGNSGRGSAVEHTYTQPGTFTAILTATGPGGNDSTSQIIKVRAACQAAFDFTPKNGEPPLEVNFDNQSTACQSYLWDFGDGTTSTEISPSHVFTPANTYVITLTATGTDNSDLMTKTVTVGDIGCYFTAEPTSGFRPLSVEFEAENCQPGTFFIWDFGDGKTTSGYDESVIHTYELTGTFSITMSSLPPNGSREEDVLPNYITVAPPPSTCVVDFSVSLNPPQPSAPPVTATFDNHSAADCVSYLWHFGDGTTSMEQNPVYTYTKGGVYTVSLVGNGTLTKSQLITIGDPIKPPAGSITVTIIPATANRQDDLEAKIAYLGDEPAGLEIRWSGNSIPQPTLDNDFVVPAIFTENGDKWCVTVTPYNIRSTGERAYGKAVGPICLFIENSPPEARNLRIRPDNPSTNDSLAVAYDYVDANDDPEGATKIRWYRDNTLQSAFNDEPAVPSSTTIEGETWCVRVTPHDGKLEGEMVEACTSISPPTNGLPRITSAEIRPVPADETDTLQLFYLYEDPDNDPEGQTQIRWYRNRQYQPGFFGQRNIPASATNIGDEWFAIIRPHDGLDFGSPFETLPLKIITTSNIAPVVDEVTISPNRPGVDADLVLKYTISDLNDDPVSVKIRWFKNGIPQPTYNDQNSVPATATKLGDSWYAIIIPSDGDLDGDPVPARSVWVRQVTENSPPKALNVFLAPAQPGENQPLSFHYTYTDEDADQEGNTQISWQLNGQEQSAFANQSAIPVAMTAKGQEWCVTVRPHDGYEYGDTVASNCVTIGEYVNTNPVALNVEILPPLPTSSDDLTLSYTFFDPDNHAEGDTEIKWYKIVNGVESYQAAFDGQTAIPAIVTAPGEQWYATVRPNDDQPSNGRGLGEMQKSSPVKINQPPTLEAATIIPAEPTEGQALVLRQTGFTDHDSELSCPAQIRWSVNDDPRSEYDNQEIIPPGTITAGQVWQATVSPNDCLEYGLPVRTNVVTVTVCEGTCRPMGAIYLPILIRQQADNIPTPTPIPLGPYEENDVVAEAYGPLEFNQRYEAYAEDEHDWYTVSLSETTSLQISVTNFVVSGMLAVYNSDLQLLATVDVTNQSLLLPPTPGSFILSNLPPGEYYLQIRATDELDMETLYHLELNQRPLSYEQPLR